MNVYEMEGFLRGQCVPRDLLVNESNAAYLVRKLSEIASVKAERDALADKCDRLEYNLGNAIVGEQEALQRVNGLAVENAALKDDYQSTPALKRMGWPKTPATDAALAAIQAQGVEKFADDLHKTAMAMCSVKPDNTTPGAYAGMARSFAKKLREAK